MSAARGFVVAVSVGVLALCCSDPPPLRVGVVFNGEGEAGAQLAAAEINSTGGIRGRPLVLRVEVESGTEARPAVLAAERLSQDDHVIAVVGHSNSNSSLAASRIYNAHGIVQIAPSSSSPALSNAGAYTFRLVASDLHQARFLVEQIKLSGASPRVAVVFVNDDYGRSLFNEVRSLLDRARIALVLDATFTSNDPMGPGSYVASAVAGSRATHLLWLGRSPQLHEVLPAVRKSLPAIQVLASDGVDTRQVSDNADKVFNGVRYVCFVNPESGRPALSALREQYRRRTGETLTSDAALAYDAVMLIARAAREAGPARKAIRDYLASLGGARPAYSGATRDIAFDTTGDAHPRYCLKEVLPQGVRVMDTLERNP